MQEIIWNLFYQPQTLIPFSHKRRKKEEQSEKILWPKTRRFTCRLIVELNNNQYTKLMQLFMLIDTCFFKQSFFVALALAF